MNNTTIKYYRRDNLIKKTHEISQDYALRLVNSVYNHPYQALEKSDKHHPIKLMFSDIWMEKHYK
ncbi:MAG: hypothetical protein GTO02_13515 [Candidatus Dadabacteria bacterium]|nr:hypothetical protein [Candidatus Dadabacteria bacterium]